MQEFMDEVRRGRRGVTVREEEEEGRKEKSKVCGREGRNERREMRGELLNKKCNPKQKNLVLYDITDEIQTRPSLHTQYLTQLINH